MHADDSHTHSVQSSASVQVWALEISEAQIETSFGHAWINGSHMNPRQGKLYKPRQFSTWSMHADDSRTHSAQSSASLQQVWASEISEAQIAAALHWSNVLRRSCACTKPEDRCHTDIEALLQLLLGCRPSTDHEFQQRPLLHMPMRTHMFLTWSCTRSATPTWGAILR